MRDAVEEEAIEVTYIPSAENKADGLTKVLVTSAFQSFKSAMHVMSRNDTATH